MIRKLNILWFVLLVAVVAFATNNQRDWSGVYYKFLEAHEVQIDSTLRVKDTIHVDFIEPDDSSVVNIDASGIVYDTLADSVIAYYLASSNATIGETLFTDFIWPDDSSNTKMELLWLEGNLYSYGDLWLRAGEKIIWTTGANHPSGNQWVTVTFDTTDGTDSVFAFLAPLSTIMFGSNKDFVFRKASSDTLLYIESDSSITMSGNLTIGDSLQVGGGNWVTNLIGASVIGDTADVVRGEIRDTIDVARSWSDIGDTCDAHDTDTQLSWSDVGDTCDAHDTDTQLAWAAIRETTETIAQDSASHYADLVRAEVRDTVNAARPWAAIRETTEVIAQDSASHYADLARADIADTVNAIRGWAAIRETTEVIAQDSASAYAILVRGEIRDTIDVARSWSDIGDTCDAHDDDTQPRTWSDIGDTADAHIDDIRSWSDIGDTCDAHAGGGGGRVSENFVTYITVAKARQYVAFDSTYSDKPLILTYYYNTAGVEGKKCGPTHVTTTGCSLYGESQGSLAVFIEERDGIK